MHIKKIVMIILFLIIIFSICSTVLATDNFDVDAFETSSKAPDEIKNLTKNSLGTYIGIVRNAAVGILLTMSMIIGAKYMLASAGERADIKKHAVAFFIAAMIIFASSTIIEVLIKVSEEIKYVGE